MTELRFFSSAGNIIWQTLRALTCQKIKDVKSGKKAMTKWKILIQMPKFPFNQHNCPI